jgi:hypothetical protein
MMDFNKAFNTYNCICDNLTSTFSFSQINETMIISASGKNRASVIANMIMFLESYDSDYEFDELNIYRVEDGVWRVEFVVSE